MEKQGQIEKQMINKAISKKPTTSTKLVLVVITVKKDKSIKIALDSRKLNEVSVKRKAQKPNMEELISRISRISRKIADGPADEIWISKIDLDYAYGQLLLSREA